MKSPRPTLLTKSRYRFRFSSATFAVALLAISVLQANPRIERVVFVAAPHRNAPMPFWSSHQADARYEKIVPYPHTAMFKEMQATDEIKRIFALHAAEAALLN